MWLKRKSNGLSSAKGYHCTLIALQTILFDCADAKLHGIIIVSNVRRISVTRTQRQRLAPSRSYNLRGIHTRSNQLDTHQFTLLNLHGLVLGLIAGWIGICIKYHVVGNEMVRDEHGQWAGLGEEADLVSRRECVSTQL